jgi:Domain of unknown function (DUF4157)
MRSYAPQAKAPPSRPATAPPGRIAAAPPRPATRLFASPRLATAEPTPALHGTGRSSFDFASLPVQPRNVLHRAATAPGPAAAPKQVHEVVRAPGNPLPENLRRDMSMRLGDDLANVRLHTDEHAGASAKAVAAQAYTVGRHIVFAPGHYDPASAPGKHLLAHELAHARTHPPTAPVPSGELRVSSPADREERHAVAAAQGAVAATDHALSPAQSAPLVRPELSKAAVPRLYRTPTPHVVQLAGASLNHKRVTVPPEATLALKASAVPGSATNTVFTLDGNNAAIAQGTSIDSATGAITVAADQTGGSATIKATQTYNDAKDVTQTKFFTQPINFAAVPGDISSTVATPRVSTTQYGGDFLHTFGSPAGGQAALELAHVNERFAGAKGTTLPLTGTMLGNTPLSVTVNDPNSARAGWDLDASGTMAGPDHVTWSNRISARPFVVNASNRTPANALPQELTVTQAFHSLSMPSNKYGATAVASTTHRRAFEDHNNKLTAITSANAKGIDQPVEQDYAGPTVFRRAKAVPDNIPTATPAPKGGKATAPTTSKISVDAEGTTAKPHFTVLAPDLGAHISVAGVLTPGTTAGTVTVRAGDAANFDEAKVTIAAPVPQAPAGATPAKPPAQPAPAQPPAQATPGVTPAAPGPQQQATPAPPPNQAVPANPAPPPTQAPTATPAPKAAP